MPRHIPLRRCVVCRRQQDKRRLTRIIMTAGGIRLDPTGKKNGRGAYLCSDTTCWKRAIDSDLLGKALRHPLKNEDRVFLADHVSRLTSHQKSDIANS